MRILLTLSFIGHTVSPTVHCHAKTQRARFDCLTREGGLILIVDSFLFVSVRGCIRQRMEATVEIESHVVPLCTMDKCVVQGQTATSGIMAAAV